MQITLNVASSGEKYPIDVEPDETIDSLLMKIEVTTGVLARLQRISYGSRTLKDNGKTLAAYNIPNGAEIKMVANKK